MTLRPIISGLLKLAAIFLALTLAAEVSLEHHRSPMPTAILTALNRTADHLLQQKGRGLFIVEWSLWVFHNKIHYLILLLVALATYYSYKGKNVPRPHLARNTDSVSDYERLKKETT
jgi:hypothetical protein